jgi:electron transfer flavoprotein alpha subunit
MKAAMVMHADADILLQAAELNSLLAGSADHLDSLEMWLFYHEKSPEHIPQFAYPLAAIRLLQVDAPDVPEAALHVLQQIQSNRKMDMLLFCSDGFGQELCTRLAYRLGGSSALTVERCLVVDDTIAVERPVYGNNLTARFHLNVRPYCLSVAKKGVPPVAGRTVDDAFSEAAKLPPLQIDWLKAWAIEVDEGESALAAAEIVLAVGNGVQSRKNMLKMQVVADTLGAEIGVSRPVVMGAWSDMNRLIGMSGHILSPRICIAAGVSGAGVFRGGIRNSRFLVAINTDKQAAIFEIADVGIVDDLFAVLFELESIVRKAKAQNDAAAAQERQNGD